MKEKMKYYDKEIEELYNIMKMWLIGIIVGTLIFMVIFLLAERGNMNYTGVNENCNNCEWESFVSEEIKKIVGG